MIQRFIQAHSFLPIPTNHPPQQINTIVRILPKKQFQVIRPVHWILLDLFSKTPVWLLKKLRPLLFCWVSDQFAHQLELVQLVASLKQGHSFLQHFSYDTSDWPNVDFWTVFSLLDQQFWRAVPQSHDFAGQRLVRDFFKLKKKYRTLSKAQNLLF